MPVVELIAAHDNRQQRRARISKSHAFVPAVRTPAGPLARRDTTHRAASALSAEQAVLLDLFGRPPVVFHRSFVEIAGGVNGALWLSHAVALSQEPGAHGDATFFLSPEQCTEATGMSTREQNHARKSLRSAGLLHECRHGGTRGYRLDLQRLASLLLQQGAVAWALQGGPLDAPVTKVLHATAA